MTWEKDEHGELRCPRCYELEFDCLCERCEICDAYKDECLCPTGQELLDALRDEVEKIKHEPRRIPRRIFPWDYPTENDNGRPDK